MSVYGIGYLRIESPDRSRWEAMTGGFGMVNDDHAGGRTLVRLDDRAYRLDLRDVGPGAGPAVVTTGIELRSRSEALDAFERLEKAGVPARWGADDECRDRLVKGFVACADPSGHRLELFFGQEQVLATKPGERPTVSYVTGDLGLGHVVLGVTDVPASVDFYCDVLGFVETEWFESKQIVFMRCNRREHSVAVMPTATPAFLHVMLEVETIDDVGIAYDECLRRGAVTKTLGRHTNDRSISFYCATPSGFEIEYGCDSLVVDDEASWTVRKLVEPSSSWGHKRMQPAPGAWS
jgi:2,3-dihydroxybiphenyl 1,2-dioxygenase